MSKQIRRTLNNARYEDRVDVVGEVRAAELKPQQGGFFVLSLENGQSITGAFTDEQEPSITQALHEHKQMRLRVVGQGEFEASGQLQRIVRVDHLEVRPAGEVPFDPDAVPIWEQIAALGKSVPEEVWDKVPTDLASNLDFYLYGVPKEEGE